MRSSTSVYVTVASICFVVIGVSTVAFIEYGERSTAEHAAAIVPTGTHIHSADWSVAHPDALRIDEKRCASDAAGMPFAACQNVASAGARLYTIEMKNAAAANTLSGTDTTKTP